MYVKTSELPESLQSFLHTLSYNKKDIAVGVVEKVSPMGAGQDGYREFIGILDLGTGEHKTTYGSWGGANPFNPNNQVDLDTASYPLPPNVVVVKGRHGGNYPTHAVLYIRSDMVAKFLPEKSSLTARQQYIVDALGSLTSAGRKDEFNSYGHIPPSAQEYKALEEMGLLKITKAGAVSLTTEGKNAKSKSFLLSYVAP
jgi:hypothetical protein